MKTKDYISLSFLIGITVGAFLFFAKYQTPILYWTCEKCDGFQYRQIYFYFHRDIDVYLIKHPFHGRILQPFISSLLNWGALDGSYVVNLFFSILSTITLFFTWKKLHFKPILILFGLFWLLFHWSGIIRYYAFDPISVDVPVYFFHSLLVLIVITKKYKWLWLVAPIALLSKESFLAYMLVFMVYAWLHNLLVEQYFPLKMILTALVLVIITKIVVGVYFPPIEEGMNSFRSVAFYIRGILQNPLDIFRWVIAIFTAFGGLFLLSLTNIRKYFKPNPEQNLILLFSIVSILFGLIAGGDRTRIMFIGFPFVMTSIFYMIQNRGVGVIFISILLSIPLMRLVSTIPPINTLEYYSWFPEFADLSTVCAWSFYMFLSYFVIKKVDVYFSK